MTDREAMQRIMQVLGPAPVCRCAGCAWETGEALHILRAQGIEYQGRHQVTAACLNRLCPICLARAAKLAAPPHDPAKEEEGNGIYPAGEGSRPSRTLRTPSAEQDPDPD